MASTVETIGLKAVLEGSSKYLSDLDKIEKAEKNLGEEMSKTAKKSDDAGKALTKMSMVGMTAFIGLGVLAVKFATDFENQMDQVGAVLQANDADMAKLGETAKQLGADTAFSAGEAAKAMHELAAGGRSVAQIIGGEAKAAVDLAAAGNYDLANSARTIATAMDIWKDSTLSTTDVVNRLSGAANASRFGVEDMSQAIASGGGVAAQAGVSFQDFSTVIAATASSFNSGSDAGTSFKTFITSLTGNSEKAKDMIKQLGLEFYTASGQLKPMSEIVQQLNDKLSGLSQQQQTVALKTIFGNDAFRTAAGLMKMTGEEFTTMSNKMRDTDASSVASQRMSNLSGSLEQLKGSMETLAIQTGEQVIPAINTLAQGATLLANAFGSLPPSTQNMVLGFSAIVVALPALISGLEKGAKFAMGLGDALQTGKGKALAFAAVLSVALVGLDILSQKTTGASLMDRIFGDVSKSEAAVAAMRSWNAQVLAAGPSVDKLALAQFNLDRATASFAENSGKALTSTSEFWSSLAEGEVSVNTFGEALLGNDKRLFGFNVGLSGAQDRSKELSETVKQLGIEMVANGASLFQLQQAYEALPPELQKTFDATTNVVAATEAYNLAAQVGGDRLEAYHRAGLTPIITVLGDLSGVVMPAAKTALDLFNDSIEDGDDRAKDFQETLDVLTGRFSSMNPEVIALEGQLSTVDEELADLDRNGKSFSDTLGMTKDQLIKVKKGLEDQIKAAGENEDAIRGLRGEMTLYVGEGLLNLEDALKDTNLPLEEQVTIAQKVAEALRALSNKDIPGFVAALDVVEKKAPGMSAVVVDNLGPGLRMKLEAEIPALQATGSAVANAIVQGLVNGFLAGQTDVGDASAKLMSEAIRRMNEVAIIGSPSEVTKAMGIFMAEGLVLGFIQGKPRVLATVEQMMNETIAHAKAILVAAIESGELTPYLGSDGQWHLPGSGAPGSAILPPSTNTHVNTYVGGGQTTGMPTNPVVGSQYGSGSTLATWNGSNWVQGGLENAYLTPDYILDNNPYGSANANSGAGAGIGANITGGYGGAGAGGESTININAQGAVFGDSESGATTMLTNAVKDALLEAAGRDAFLMGVR